MIEMDNFLEKKVISFIDINIFRAVIEYPEKFVLDEHLIQSYLVSPELHRFEELSRLFTILVLFERLQEAIDFINIQFLDASIKGEKVRLNAKKYAYNALFSLSTMQHILFSLPEKKDYYLSHFKQNIDVAIVAGFNRSHYQIRDKIGTEGEMEKLFQNMIPYVTFLIESINKGSSFKNGDLLSNIIDICTFVCEKTEFGSYLNDYYTNLILLFSDIHKPDVYLLILRSIRSEMELTNIFDSYFLKFDDGIKHKFDNNVKAKAKISFNPNLSAMANIIFKDDHFCSYAFLQQDEISLQFCDVRASIERSPYLFF